MSSLPVRILMVEDHKLMRVGLKSLFDDYDDLMIAAEAENGKEAMEIIKSTQIDVVLLDLGLPDISGTELTKKILEYNKKIKVVILTSHLTEKEIFEALSAGASAYVLKDINTEMLMMIIRSSKMGAMWIDPQAVPILRDKNNGTVIPQRQMTRAAFREQHSNLTQREYEVLKLVVDGKSNHEIAETLTISEHTAKAHVCNIIQKLVVDDRTQAAVKALKEGLV